MIGGISNGGFGAGFGSPFRTGGIFQQQAVKTGASGAGLRDLAGGVVGLRKALGGIFSSAGVRGRALGRVSESSAAAQSTGSLGLDLSETATTLTSSGEVLTVGSGTIGNSKPKFSGSSTSQATVGGTYHGATDDKLTFQVKGHGVTGVKDIKIEVRDSSGRKIDQFTIERGEPTGTIHKLDNGLEVSFSFGFLEKQDTFTVDVFASGNPDADPNRLFGTQGSGRRMFDPGELVKPGTFDVNGVGIQVTDQDSIQSVLQKITSSSAGVEASFDAATDKITLKNKQTGAQNLQLGNDTSGFLSAVKLDDARPQLGKASDLDLTLDSLSRFKGLKKGRFSVGDQSIRVDPTKDTLADVLRRVDALDGISAKYDAASDKVSIAADEPGKSFTLGRDTSGILKALRLDEGSYGSERVVEEERRSGGLQVTRGQVFRDSLRDFGQSLQSILSSDFGGTSKSEADKVLREVQDAVSAALDEFGRDGEGDVLRTGLGIDFRFGDESERGVDIDQRRLQRALERDGDALGRLLFGEGGPDGDKGLAARLDEALEAAGQKLAGKLKPGNDVGLILDLKG